MPTEEQLKLALAKAFPQIIFKSCSDYYWTKPNSKTDFDKVTPREWLQVCWEIEETLVHSLYEKYFNILEDETGHYHKGKHNAYTYDEALTNTMKIIHANFIQRATALLKVKEIEI